MVKNVKKTHQLQESGEFQEFNDDVEYFLDALRSSYPVPTRCLAALNLAQKCMVPSFRMHLRAHGTVIKFFSALSDAHSDHVSYVQTSSLLQLLLVHLCLSFGCGNGSYITLFDFASIIFNLLVWKKRYVTVIFIRGE